MRDQPNVELKCRMEKVKRYLPKVGGFVKDLLLFNTLSALKYGSFAYVMVTYGGILSMTTGSLTEGESMTPTITTNDMVVWEGFSSVTRRKRGDVIWAWHPLDSNKRISKRIRGLPGDQIKYREVDIKTGDENEYLVTVPTGHMWLEGDNHSLSRDSRDYGPVPLNLYGGLIFGKRSGNSLWFTKLPTKQQPTTEEEEQKDQ
eukprot:TRINITY_DN15508_c0_g1_i1.p1 TRINITY_DN15508_c0_g1~~TRINITY_DN15508_c0_g1_i1.p1  ORF type:complete len:202 (+),score=27.92 TRINITY_DN15508_c0_g1_i1:27-632(+)